MSWKFEKVFEATPDSAPKEVIQDGRFLYVTGSSILYIYEFAGQSSFHEPPFESLEELNYANYDGKLKLLTSVPIPEGSAWLCKSFSNIWIANDYKATKLTQVNIASRAIVTTIDLPTTMNSNFIFEADRILMVSKAKEDQEGSDRQRLYIFNPSTLKFASIEIPVKKQLARAFITSGYNGFVYVTNFNNVSLSKFSTATWTYEGQVRTNAFPRVATVTPSRDIFVASYGGMLTRINGLTDEVFNAYSTVYTATSLSAVDDNSVWYTCLKEGQYVDTNIVGKVNRLDNSLLFTGNTKDDTGENYQDWNIESDSISDKEFTRVLITTPFTYQQFDGASWNAVDVKPYLIMLGASKIMAVRLDRYLMRENYIQLSGQAMISTGSEDYMGEVC